MLAFPVPLRQPDLPQIPQSHPQDASHSQSMTTPVLMSPCPRPQQSQMGPPRLQRPRLCIDTQQNRTFGKGSSLRLETLSAISPTIRNTFSNGYEPKASSVDSNNCLETPSTPGDTRTPSSTSSSSASTILEAHVIPYIQPHALKSALSNSPIPRADFRRMSISQPRPMFPPEKRVSFRDPLSEEIQTTRFTWAHSDISFEEPPEVAMTGEEEECSGASDGSSDTISLGSTDTESTEEPTSQHSDNSTQSARLAHRHTRTRPKSKGPSTGDKRDSSSDESDSDACPETPVAGRRKRVREWTWTLGALPGQATQTNTIANATTDPTESANPFATTTTEEIPASTMTLGNPKPKPARLGLWTSMDSAQ